jgi:hypothetical protein
MVDLKTKLIVRKLNRMKDVQLLRGEELFLEDVVPNLSPLGTVLLCVKACVWVGDSETRCSV